VSVKRILAARQHSLPCRALYKLRSECPSVCPSRAGTNWRAVSLR